MNNKTILIFAALLVIFSIGVNALDACTDNNDPTAEDVSITLNGTPPSITVGEDEKWYNLTSVTIDAQVTIDGINESITILNTTSILLDWMYIDTGSLVVYNASNGAVLGAGNYTINYTTGNLTFNLSVAGWNNSAAYVTYNRTFNTTENLVNWATFMNYAPYSITASSEYGGTTTYTPLLNGTGYADDLNGTEWTLTYYYTTRDCAARDGCQNTKAIIFAAFTLMSLFAIVGSGFLIVGLFSGGDGLGSLMGMGIGLIALSIVLFIGYLIISQVGMSVCLV